MFFAKPGRVPGFFAPEEPMLIERITEDMKQAMKSGDKLKLSTIRMLRAAIKDKQIELGSEPPDAVIHALISKMVKQRRDAARQFAEGGRHDLEARELAEAQLLEVYLPEQMGEQELLKLIDHVITETHATSMRDMGRVMGGLKSRVMGRADMGRVNALVKKRLGTCKD